MLKKGRKVILLPLLFVCLIGAASCNKDDSSTDGNELRKKIDEYNLGDEGLKDYYTPDDYTWLDNFPVAGRKNYPLLFDVNLDPKAAYFEIIDF